MALALAGWPAARAAAAGTASDSTVAAPPAAAAAQPDTTVRAAPEPGVADSAARVVPRLDVPADSTAHVAPGRSVPPDSAAAGVAPPRERRTLPPQGAFSTPAWVMLRSAIVPGWGQAYNRAWWKAGAVAIVEGLLAYRIYDDNRVLGDLDREAAAATAAGDLELQNAIALRYNDRLDRMVAREWLLGGVVVYSLLDAYVDAHFRGFDVEFKTDPALPGGEPASVGARAGLRWTF